MTKIVPTNAGYIFTRKHREVVRYIKATAQKRTSFNRISSGFMTRCLRHSSSCQSHTCENQSTPWLSILPQHPAEAWTISLHSRWIPSGFHKDQNILGLRDSRKLISNWFPNRVIKGQVASRDPCRRAECFNSAQNAFATCPEPRVSRQVLSVTSLGGQVGWPASLRHTPGRCTQVDRQGRKGLWGRTEVCVMAGSQWYRVLTSFN